MKPTYEMTMEELAKWLMEAERKERQIERMNQAYDEARKLEEEHGSDMLKLAEHICVDPFREYEPVMSMWAGSNTVSDEQYERNYDNRQR